MTAEQIQECLDYAKSLIETRLGESTPRLGSDIYARTTGERRVYWLEKSSQPPLPQRSRGVTQIDFQGFFTKRNQGQISYSDINDSWNSESETPNIIQFSALFYPSGNVSIINDLFLEQAVLFQDYTQEQPYPVQGYNKIDLEFTFNPIELPFPVRVAFAQKTTINGEEEEDEVIAAFDSTNSQTLDFSLDTFGSRVIRLDRVEN